jgi:hypothetical protein
MGLSQHIRTALAPLRLPLMLLFNLQREPAALAPAQQDPAHPHPRAAHWHTLPAHVSADGPIDVRNLACAPVPDQDSRPHQRRFRACRHASEAREEGVWQEQERG